MHGGFFKLSCCFALGCAAMLFAVTAGAQQLANLETIVVTGTKTARSLADVPVKTEVITREELQKRHVRDLAEALRFHSGIQLQEIHGKSGYSVVMQGIGADRVLVLIDGRPVTPSTGSTVDLSQLSINDVEHIEVVRGAVSALYGSSAMGGVINIITRNQARGGRYKLVADAGSWGDKNVDDKPGLASRHLSLDGSYKAENWFGSASLDLRSSDGFDLDTESYTTQGDEGEKINLGFELGYEFENDSSISYKPSIYREDLSRRVGEYLPGTGEIRKIKTELVDKHSHILAYDKTFSNLDKLSVYWISERFSDDTTQDVLVTPETEGKRHAELDFDKAELQYDSLILDEHLLTAGLVLYQSSLRQSREGNSETVPNLGHETIELYLQDDLMLSDQWEFLPGIRVQRDSDFGAHAAAKLNVLYSPQWNWNVESKIRLGIGQGYRVPDLKERGYIFDHHSIGYIVLGSEVDQWQDETLGVIDLSGARVLDPEESVSLQAGIELRFPNQSRIDISLFYNAIENLIDTDQYSGEEVSDLNYSVYRYVNIAKATTQGMDFAYAKKVSPAFQFDFSYSFLHAIDDNTGNDLVLRPDHQLQMTMEWLLPQWKSDFSLLFNWQSPEYTDSDNTNESPEWHAVDLKYNYRMNNTLTLFSGVNNLTDVHKDPAKGDLDRRPKEGRYIYFGIKLQSE